MNGNDKSGCKLIRNRGDRNTRTRPRVFATNNFPPDRDHVSPPTSRVFATQDRGSSPTSSGSLWQNGAWISSFPEETNTMSDQDFSPGFAIRKIALLFENRRWEDCALLINKLSMITLRTILSELPVDLIIDSVPSSLPIVEALYMRMYNSGDPSSFPSHNLHPEQLIGKLVKWMASFQGEYATKQTNSYEYYIPMVLRILQIISRSVPRIKQKVKSRERSLGKCMDSLGSHGLVDTSDIKLMNMHEALKTEFNRMSQQLRLAVSKLDELSLTQKALMGGGASRGSGPASHTKSSTLIGCSHTGSSHHKLHQLTQLEIQERLIKNKSLLNVVEPAMRNKYLANLIHTLDKRIEADKEVRFNYNRCPYFTKSRPLLIKLHPISLSPTPFLSNSAP